ncbi:MAG: hypothetical protein LBF12_05530 [Christensenellaceae bacterium]|jgi:hypothetical protein|nr:hypothetical protein [Christensenellaceae bacterium]
MSILSFLRTTHKNKNIDIPYIGRTFAIVFFVIFLSMQILISYLLISDGLYATGTYADVLHDTNEVFEYIDRTYSNKQELQFLSAYKKIIPNSNLDQGAFNNYYNDFYNYTSKDTMVSGTCSEVAVTLLTKAHKVNQGSYEYIFRTVMNTAKGNGYWKSDKGTNSAQIDSLVTKTFDFLNSSKKGNNDHLNIFSNLVNNIDSGKTSVFSCIGHSMHAVGYAEYSIKYSEKILFFKRNVAKTEYFVIVNDGWFNASSNEKNEQYSYYPASLISTRFTLTKVV